MNAITKMVFYLTNVNITYTNMSIIQILYIYICLVANVPKNWAAEKTFMSK